MRRILFRGKAVGTGEWVYGYYCGPIVACIRHEISDINSINDGIGNGVNIDPATLGQHTGAYDKTGRGVYEGDILLLDGYPDDPLYIAYDNDRSMFCFKSKKYIYLTSSMSSGDRFVITGNIHDNPELLGGGSNG